MTDKILELAYKIRVFENKVLQLAGSKTIKGTTHTCIGQEIIPVTLMNFAKKDDFVISNHRSHGHFLAKTLKFSELAKELMGLESGLNSGIGGSQHLKDENFISSGIQGSLLPFALGIASANKSNGNITIVYVGDGTFGEGVLYEVLNWASLWKLPILFVVEDNHYAQSTKKISNFSGSFEGRSSAFDIKFFETNSFEFESLMKNCEAAVSHVRKSLTPAMLHVDTYRLSPHSKGDDLRDIDEIKSFKEKDLLTHFEKKIKQEDIQKIKAEIDQFFDVAGIENSLNPIVLDSSLQFIEESTHQICMNENQGFLGKKINQALEKCFHEHDDLILIGEDVEDPYGGAFKVTKDLSVKYPGRVQNTPISENALIGFAAGRSFMGLKTVAEIMFGDFFALAFDQFLNVISKNQSMYGKLKPLPVLIRIPTGPNGSYGATHSQEVSQYFQNIPFIELRFVTIFSDINSFYLNCLSNESQMASVVFETKKSYSYLINKQDLSLLRNYKIEQLGKSGDANIKITSANPDITVIVHPFYSTEIVDLLKISEEYEVVFDLFIPENLKKFSYHQIKNSLSKTKKLFVWDSGFYLTGSFLNLIMKLKEEIDFEFDFCTVEPASIPANEFENNMFYNYNKILNKLRILYEK